MAAAHASRVDFLTGLVGSLLFGLLLCVAVWRLGVHLRRVGPFSVFKRCHVVIVLYAALDIPRYVLGAWTHKAVEFQSGLPARIVYALHLLGTWLQVVALTMVILMWSSVFSGRSRGPEASRILRRNRIITRSVFILMNLLLLVATLVLGCRLLTDSHSSTLNESLGQDPLYFSFVATSSGCLFVCAGGILAYGVKMRYKIAHHAWRAAALPTIQKLLRTLNTTMGVCTVMFALRIAMLMSLFDGRVRDNEALNELEWNLLSYWIPTIVSASVLLYLMRGGADRSSQNRRSRRFLIKGQGRRGPAAGTGASAVVRVDDRHRAASRDSRGLFGPKDEDVTTPFAGSLPHGHSVTYDAIPTSPNTDHYYSASPLRRAGSNSNI